MFNIWNLVVLFLFVVGTLQMNESFLLVIKQKPIPNTCWLSFVKEIGNSECCFKNCSLVFYVSSVGCGHCLPTWVALTR